MDDTTNVLYEVREGLAWITVHRPEKLNALDRRTVEGIVRAVDRAVSDAAVGVLVLTGAGDRAFVAGADIREMSELTAAEAQRLSSFLHDAMTRLERAPKPVVAAVNGFALGGGCELALACHLRIAADTARFGQPEVGLGLIPGAGGTQRLVRVIGRGRALELILTGEAVDAAAAERMGLVNRVVPAAALHDEVTSLGATLRARSPVAQARALEAVIAGADLPLAESLRLEAALFGLCFATDDMREGTRAFLERRKATFHGR